jgi:hypothetical protein
LACKVDAEPTPFGTIKADFLIIKGIAEPRLSLAW